MSGPVETVRTHWADPVPDWIQCLAEECKRSNQVAVAKRLNRSPGMISQVLRAKYPGDMASFEEAVRGAYMHASVICPSLGSIPTDACQQWRRKARKFINVNSLRVRMFRACSNCPRNVEKGG